MSDPTREVLYRFSGEVDPSIRKSLNEISQLAAKTEKAATLNLSRRTMPPTTQNISRGVREQDRVAKEMKRAELAQFKQEQANLKQQQRDAKQAERARQQTLRSNQIAQQSAVRYGRQFDAAMVSASGSALSLAKGLALLGIAGEENTEKLLRSFIKIEGGFMVLRSGINTVRSLTAAWRAHNAAVAAGAIARGVAGAAGGAGGIGAGAAGGVAGSFLAGGVLSNPYIAIPGALLAGGAALAYGHTKSGSEQVASFYSRLAWNLGQSKDPLLSPYYKMAEAQELTKKRQRERDTAMTAARIQAMRSSEAMQLSGAQAQGSNMMLDLQGEMPLGQFMGFSPSTRKFAAAGYKSNMDIQRMLIAQRDFAQTQAALPALRNAAEMTGSTLQDWQNYANGVSQYKARIEELKTSGFAAADSLREMKLAAEEFDLAGKNKTLALALRPPNEQAQINTAMAKIRTRTADRKDILKAAPYMPGGLFPEEESWIESQFLQAPEATRRGQEWNRRIQKDIQEGQRLAGLNVNHAVAVTLQQNPDQLVEALRQSLEPAIERMRKDQDAIIKHTSQQIMDDVSRRLDGKTEDMAYGLR